MRPEKPGPAGNKDAIQFRHSSFFRYSTFVVLTATSTFRRYDPVPNPRLRRGLRAIELYDMLAGCPAAAIPGKTRRISIDERLATPLEYNR
jgi:hypothetical protein